MSINSPESDQPGEALNPALQLQKFVTEIWMHSLLNKETQDFRKALEEEAKRLIIQAQSPTAIILPGGSAIWAASLASSHDFDMHIISDNPQAFSRLVAEHNKKPGDLEIQMLSNVKPTELGRNPLFFKSDPYFALLTTPDDLIAGDPHQAARLRLEAIRKMMNSPYRDGYREAFEEWYDTFIRFWETSNKLDFQTDMRGNLKRKARMSILLNARSQQEADPIAWKKQFQEQRQQRNLPSFATFSEALNNSNGSIRINPNFIQQGIRRT